MEGGTGTRLSVNTRTKTIMYLITDENSYAEHVKQDLVGTTEASISLQRSEYKNACGTVSVHTHAHTHTLGTVSSEISVTSIRHNLEAFSATCMNTWMNMTCVRHVN